MRLRRIFAVTVLAALIAVPTALALGFEDSDFPLPNATVGVPYSFQLTGRGGCGPSSYTFTVSSGTLPPGIQLSSSGLLNGSATQPGSWSFYLQLATGGSCSSQAPSQRPFTLNVIPKLTVTSPSPLAPGVVGVPYSAQMTNDGGGSVVWSVSSGVLPAGLTLSPTGLLAGTPTTVGVSSFQVFAKDTTSMRTDTKTLSLEILAPLAASVGTAPAAEVGIPFKGLTPAATGGKTPYTWTLAGGNPPAGLSVDPGTGALTGTPTAAGTFTFKLGVKDALSSIFTVDATVTVAPKLTITTRRLAATKVGRPYQATVRTHGGVEPIKWKVTSGRFPVGLRLDRTTGIISGTPRTAGVFTITVTVTDKLGGTSEQTLSLAVKAKPKPKK